MTDTASPTSPAERLRPLRQVRQYRDFTDQPVAEDVLRAIADVARWSGSSQNEQPWRFVLVRDRATIRAWAAAGLPQTRTLRTAPAAIAIVLPDRPQRAVADAYDEGRAAERCLIAASQLGLGAGIAWIRPDVRQVVADALGLPADRFVRTVVAVGHPTEAARQPKMTAGSARLPRAETVFEERWPPER
ncbi:MAG TPA: nitroreductase family protein [Candidatus Limnocylindrales bacterium]